MRTSVLLRDKLNASVLIGDVCEASDMIRTVCRKLDKACRVPQLAAAINAIAHIDQLEIVAADLARVAREAEE